MNYQNKSRVRKASAFELKGFAPIGMMEQWNCGMMGLKKAEFKAHIFALIFLF
jgi:hypothetical protein